TIQCTLGLVCDPVAGLVEVPCVVRNASAAAIAFSSAQMALAEMSGVIPVDECVEAMGEIGQSMENRYKETALGGLANTPTAQKIAKKVYQHPVSILSPEFQKLVARSLAAKEVNSCMGRVVAAPTAGASGIIPGTLYTLQEIHQLEDQKILEGMLVAAGIGLIIEQKASLAGAVGGCQAETGSAAAMASGAMIHCLGGTIDQIFNAIAITIQCTLGLVCDPVAGLVEVPCVVRNASAAAIAYSSAQMALAEMSGVIPVDECVEAMGEIGQSMENRYKETALGGLATTPTAQKIAKKVLISDIDILPEEGSGNS
ncbi:MAG: L-serine ammonia-lyase, iron-sulfur-dependent, subunit beta, partial [Cyclobacteriaceae bacterium]